MCEHGGRQCVALREVNVCSPSSLDASVNAASRRVAGSARVKRDGLLAAALLSVPRGRGGAGSSAAAVGCVALSPGEWGTDWLVIGLVGEELLRGRARTRVRQLWQAFL